MVDQNYVVYVNDKKNLRTVPIVASSKDGVYVDLKFSINEKHLICGLILKGRPIKGNELTCFPFKPIEKYLFEFSNIHFFVLENEFTAENQEYVFLGEENQNFFNIFNAGDYYIKPFVVDLDCRMPPNKYLAFELNLIDDDDKRIGLFQFNQDIEFLGGTIFPKRGKKLELQHIATGSGLVQYYHSYKVNGIYQSEQLYSIGVDVNNIMPLNVIDIPYYCEGVKIRAVWSPSEI